MYVEQFQMLVNSKSPAVKPRSASNVPEPPAANLIAPSSSVDPSTVFEPSPNKLIFPSTTLAVTPVIPAA